MNTGTLYKTPKPKKQKDTTHLKVEDEINGESSRSFLKPWLEGGEIS